VLVVNDGSTDATAAVLAGLQERYPRLRVFTHRRSRGMTAGLQRMFSASQGDIVILIPADMESDPLLDVPALVRHAGSQRPGRGAGWRQGRNDNKVLASKVYNFVMRIAGVHGARRQLDQGDAPRGGGQLPAAAQRLAPLSADDRRSQRLSRRRDADLLPAAPGGQQQVWLGTHPQELSRRAGAQVPADLQRGADALLWRAGAGGAGDQRADLSLPDRLYIFTQTQQRPIFIAAGVLAIISMLLFLVGFLAELIVNQGERIG
jgi:hypothetical protein